MFLHLSNFSIVQNKRLLSTFQVRISYIANCEPLLANLIIKEIEIRRQNKKAPVLRFQISKRGILPSLLSKIEHKGFVQIRTSYIANCMTLFAIFFFIQRQFSKDNIYTAFAVLLARILSTSSTSISIMSAISCGFFPFFDQARMYLSLSSFLILASKVLLFSS